MKGILTDRDIVVTVVGRDAEAKTMMVMDIMIRSALLAAEGQSVPAVLKLMRADGIRRVPVVGMRNELVGVLSIDDVLNVVADELATLSGVVRGARAASA